MSSNTILITRKTNRAFVHVIWCNSLLLLFTLLYVPTDINAAINRHEFLSKNISWQTSLESIFQLTTFGGNKASWSFELAFRKELTRLLTTVRKVYFMKRYVFGHLPRHWSLHCKHMVTDTPARIILALLLL